MLDMSVSLNVMFEYCKKKMLEEKDAKSYF